MTHGKTGVLGEKQSKNGTLQALSLADTSRRDDRPIDQQWRIFDSCIRKKLRNKPSRSIEVERKAQSAAAALRMKIFTSF
jgi:hypothetical protein